MRFGGFVLTYRRPAILRSTIGLLLEQTCPPETILVIDNANCRETETVVRSFPRERVIYEAMAQNLGSAGGTAYGIQTLYAKGYDVIFCGDDDDPPKFPDTLERLKRIVTSSHDKVAGAGAFGALWDWNKGELKRLPDEKLTGIVEVDVIGGNAHMTLGREAIHAFGLPNSNLFFGYPDVEYCLRIKKAGYRLLIDGDLMRRYREKLNRINLVRRRALLPRRGYKSMWRNYYTTRNYIYMMRNTFERSDLASRETCKALARLPFSWLRGPRYGWRFSLLQLRAVWDAYQGRMGCTISPGEK